ncbi:MAG: hypothetical protein V3T17_12810 [Pseudomonadales bacterium]
MPAMKTTIDHLPDDKQDEIRHVVESIEEAVNPGMVILFSTQSAVLFYRYHEGGCCAF